MQRTLWKRFGYSVLKLASRVVGVVFFALRCRGRDHVPKEGAVVICSNHQSVLDPVLVGLCLDRRMNCLARQSLFRFPIFGSILRFVDSIPIDRDGGGLSGVKAAMRCLKRGEIVTIFAEGTRTHDGYVGPLKPGFCTLARRTRAQLLPLAFDGAFDAWPRTARLPRSSDIAVTIGQPITVEQIKELSDEELIVECHRRMVACHADARSRRLSQRGRSQ